MLKILTLLLLTALMACGGAGKPVPAAADTTKVVPSFKPGFGEFMSGIQVHHEKLWFAGINENWELADFEMHEIGESLDDLKVYCTDRPELRSLVMIEAPMDSLTHAIAASDTASFRKQFVYLTRTCNNCHQETAHGFNVIRMPERPPFSNQEFRLPKKP